MRESLYRRTFDNITVVMIALKNFKHALFPRNRQLSIASEGLTKQSIEIPVNTPQGSIAHRNFLSGGGYKYDGKALRERVNEENSYNSHSSINYHEVKKSIYNLSKESNTSLSTMQLEKKASDKESSLSSNKDNFQANKRPSSISRKELNNGNDENQISGSYYDYLHHSHIVKPKSMDYKSGDFMRFNVKGAK